MAASEREGKGRESEGRGRSFTLPSRSNYFAAVSSIAFVAGVGFGVVFAIRHARRMRLEELRAAAQEASGQRSNTSLGSNVAIRKPTDENALNSALSRGPFALFREMNKAAYTQLSSGAGSGRAPAKSPAPSVFDAPSSAPPPSVLMRSPSKKAGTKEADRVRHGERKVEPTAELEEIPLGQQPAIMGVKALGIATALVGVAAWVSVEVSYRVLGVKNRDELIDRLGTVIPASERGTALLGPFGDAARRAVGGTFDDDDEKAHERDDVLIVDGHGAIDIDDVDGTLEQLDQAVERGDTVAWFDVLSRRLNAERRQDIEERKKRIEAANEMQRRQSL